MNTNTAATPLCTLWVINGHPTLIWNSNQSQPITGNTDIIISFVVGLSQPDYIGVQHVSKVAGIKRKCNGEAPYPKRVDRRITRSMTKDPPTISDLPPEPLLGATTPPSGGDTLCRCGVQIDSSLRRRSREEERPRGNETRNTILALPAGGGETRKRTTILDLPNEILFWIAKSLPSKDVLGLALTSPSLYNSLLSHIERTKHVFEVAGTPEHDSLKRPPAPAPEDAESPMEATLRLHPMAASGIGALHRAVSQGNIVMARLLLKAGCSANEITTEGVTPLLCAVSEGVGKIDPHIRLEMVQLLVDAGAVCLGPTRTEIANGVSVVTRREEDALHAANYLRITSPHSCHEEIVTIIELRRILENDASRMFSALYFMACVGPGAQGLDILPPDIGRYYKGAVLGRALTRGSWGVVSRIIKACAPPPATPISSPELNFLLSAAETGTMDALTTGEVARILVLPSLRIPHTIWYAAMVGQNWAMLSLLLRYNTVNGFTLRRRGKKIVTLHAAPDGIRVMPHRTMWSVPI